MKASAALLACISGILITLSLKPLAWWGLAIVAAAMLHTAVQGKSIRQTFCLCLLFSISLFASGVSWVYVSIEEFGNASPPFAAFLTILFCCGLAIVNASIWILFAITKNSGNYARIKQLLLFAAIGTLTESLRSWLFSGFPWLLIGYSQTEAILAGWAPVIGVYGISFMLYFSGAVISTYALAWFKERAIIRKKDNIIALIALLVFWVTPQYLGTIDWTRNKNTEKTVSLIQTNISQHDKWRPELLSSSLRLYTDMSEKEWHKSDLVIWPEAAIATQYRHARSILNKMDATASQQQSALITGIPYQSIDVSTGTSNIHNSVVGVGHSEGIYHKQRLVPFGEFIPFENIVGQLMAFFELPLSSMQPGGSDQQPLRIHDWHALPLICYEIVYPTLTARAASVSDVLITVSNDAWFGASLGPVQHLQMAQMRALENGRYLLRSTGTGISAIINPRGKIVNQSEQFKQQVVRGEFYLRKGLTPWSRLGYWLIHVITASIFIIIVLLNYLSKPPARHDT